MSDLSRGMELETLTLPITRDGNCPNCGFHIANFFIVFLRDADAIKDKKLIGHCHQCHQIFISYGGVAFNDMKQKGLL